MKTISTLFFGILILIPTLTQAETVLRTGSEISVESDQSVAGDYYVSVGPMGSTVMSGSVLGDMYAAGASVTVNGDIGQDLSILAGDVQVHAPVSDDVRVVGGEVTIAEDIGGDVFVLAGTLSVLSTATIAGDVFFFGGDMVLDGTVEGSVFGTAQSLVINAGVGADVDVTVSQTLTLGDDANIEGSVIYTSPIALSRGAGTRIGGDVFQRDVAIASARQQIRDILMPIFVTLFATLSLYLLLRKELEIIVASIEKMFIRNLLIGSGLILLGPITAIILMATVLGFLIGILTLSVVVMLYVAGIALCSVVLGAFIMKLFTKKLEVTLLTVLIGSLSLQAVLVIPVVGILTVYVLFALTVGALTQQLYKAVV